MNAEKLSVFGLLVVVCLMSITPVMNASGQTQVFNADVQSVAVLPPSLNFTYDISWDCRTVTFTSTYHWCNNFTWDFTGDGSVDAYGFSVVYTYPSDGMFTVKHWAYDLTQSFNVSRPVYIGWPTPDFTYMVDELTVSLVDASSDCDGSVTYQAWDFTADGRLDAFGSQVNFTYPASGTYTIGLLVQDNDGHASTITKTVAVDATLYPDLVAFGDISYSQLQPAQTITDEIRVENQGDDGSLLDWEIVSFPSWGTWTFTPPQGYDLGTTGATTIAVTVTVPSVSNDAFSGDIVLRNMEDSSDEARIPVAISTQKTRVFSWEWMLEQWFPGLSEILFSLMG